jgi:hypothetical protein
MHLIVLRLDMLASAQYQTHIPHKLFPREMNFRQLDFTLLTLSRGNLR